MAFTFTINGKTYTSDPANLAVPDGYRFFGYGYVAALGNLATDFVTVVNQSIQSAADSAGASEESALASLQSATLAGQNAIAANESAVEAAQQVGLAAQQVGLAAQQVTLAGQQVALAAEHKDAASGYAEAAEQAAIAAQASTGIPTITGHAGKALVVNEAGNALVYKDLSVPYVEYDNRAALRALDKGDIVVVTSLGLFAWREGEMIGDDDETRFVTATGRWELEAVAPDYIHSAIGREADALEQILTKQQILRGLFNMTITSLAANAVVTFTCSVPGARSGDAAVVCPTATLDANVVFWANVTSDERVTVQIRNLHTSNAASLTSAYWPVVVIKQQ